MLAAFPSVAAQFADATPARPFIYAPRIAYRCARVVGPQWAMLPSAAGVIDPLLSTGFPLTLLGILRLTRLFEKAAPGTPHFEAGMGEYARQTVDELDATEHDPLKIYANNTLVGQGEIRVDDGHLSVEVTGKVRKSA